MQAEEGEAEATAESEMNHDMEQAFPSEEVLQEDPPELYPEGVFTIQLQSQLSTSNLSFQQLPKIRLHLLIACHNKECQNMA